jgi:hypothetical protein
MLHYLVKEALFIVFGPGHKGIKIERLVTDEAYSCFGHLLGYIAYQMLYVPLIYRNPFTIM